MKKYTKPAIEVVEANLSANCMQEISRNDEVGGSPDFAPGKKGKDYDEDDDFSEGW